MFDFYARSSFPVSFLFKKFQVSFFIHSSFPLLFFFFIGSRCDSIIIRALPIFSSFSATLLFLIAIICSTPLTTTTATVAYLLPILPTTSFFHTNTVLSGSSVSQFIFSSLIHSPSSLLHPPSLIHSHKHEASILRCIGEESADACFDFSF